jgi:hypothetical protein
LAIGDLISEIGDRRLAFDSILAIGFEDSRVASSRANRLNRNHKPNQPMKKSRNQVATQEIAKSEIARNSTQPK